MGLVLDESKNIEDLHNINDTEILIAESVAALTKDATIDYVTNSYSSGFIIRGARLSGC